MTSGADSLAEWLCLDPLVFAAGEAFPEDVVQLCVQPAGHEPPHASEDGWQWS